jgi:hypothetical protein
MPLVVREEQVVLVLVLFHLYLAQCLLVVVEVLQIMAHLILVVLVALVVVE